jgi:nucleoside 2-deoxyribosyltransferase
MMQVYLAGPEVFLPGGSELVDRKRAMCVEFGFEPTRRHAEFTEHALRAPGALGDEISRINEDLMDGADLCIANLTPFRGISADVGTVFELGYMVAQGKPVYGFTNDPRDYRVRAEDHFGSVVQDGDHLTSPDGQMIENHGMADNLMIDGGIRRRGWTLCRAETRPNDVWSDLTVFRHVLSDARAQLQS